MVKIKDYEFKEIKITNSYNRRDLKYKNKIINSLRIFGLTEDDMDIPLESVAMRKAQASVSWYMWEEHLFFSYNGSAKFVDNLAMISQVIDYFIYLLEEKKITQEEFLKTFVEDKDILEQRKEAREVLGVDEDSTNFEEMHKNFKKLSVKHHPDMPGGDTKTFQKINRAHKTLKKELC